MHIHQVKGRHVNSYVIENSDGLFVVDVAWRGEKYVLGYIREVLARPIEDVRLVLCTHSDPDHSGGVGRLAQICNAELAFPYASRSPLLKFVNDPTGMLVKTVTSLLEGMRPRAWAMYANPRRGAKARALPAYSPALEDYSASGLDAGEPMPAPAPNSTRLKNRHSLPGFADWEVVHTPGHSWDSCCYFHRPSGSLISGDTLLGSSRKGSLVVPSVYANPLQMRRSLRRLKALKPRAVYPGHGSCFSGEGLLDQL